MAPRVVVYQGREAPQWIQGLRAARIHRAGDLELYVFDRELVTTLVETLDRRMSLAVSYGDGDLLVAFGNTTISTALRRLQIFE